MNHFKKYSLSEKNIIPKYNFWGAIASAGAGLAQGIFNGFQNQKNAEANLEFQKENLEYQKALQQQIFEREDTSYQRTKNDMLKAGLNPLSMNGTNGAGEAIMTSAPQIDQSSGQLNLDSAVSALGNIQNEFLQSRAQKAQIKSQTLDNAIKEATLDSEIEAKNKGNEKDIATYDFMKKFGLTDISPDWEKSLTAIQNIVDSGKYLSLLDSSKKLVSKLAPEIKNLYNNVVKDAENQLFSSMKNEFSEPKKKVNASAPKPKTNIFQKAWDYIKSPDDSLPDYISKNKRTRENNKNYWKNYANSYKK